MKNALKFIAVMLILSMSFSLASCFGGGGTTTVDGEDVATEIIIYTNQTSGGRGAELEKLIEAANFPFEVLLVELAGQNLKSRLINEKNMPLGDVVLGGSTAEYIELKEEGVITPYVPTWASEVDAKYNDADGYFTAWAIEPLYMVYNTKYYTNDSSKVTNSLKLAPTSWEDLATNFKGKYNVFKPSSTSGTNIYASILSQYRDDENGIYGVSQEGWDLLANVINNGVLDTGLWQANLAQKKDCCIGMSWAGAIIEIEEAYECDLEVVVPEEGVPVSISQVAIVNTGDEARFNAAKMFVEWWGKTETQVAWSEISRQAPANKTALAQVDQEIRDMVDVKFLDLDYTFIAKWYSKWREKIELEIVG